MRFMGDSALMSVGPEEQRAWFHSLETQKDSSPVRLKSDPRSSANPAPISMDLLMSIEAWLSVSCSARFFS